MKVSYKLETIVSLNLRDAITLAGISLLTKEADFPFGEDGGVETTPSKIKEVYKEVAASCPDKKIVRWMRQLWRKARGHHVCRPSVNKRLGRGIKTLSPFSDRDGNIYSGMSVPDEVGYSYPTFNHWSGGLHVMTRLLGRRLTETELSLYSEYLGYGPRPIVQERAAVRVSPVYYSWTEAAGRLLEAKRGDSVEK